ncbi:MAG: DUF4190 domain-containing protein [Ornithinimicrobium sp.]
MSTPPPSYGPYDPDGRDQPSSPYGYDASARPVEHGHHDHAHSEQSPSEQYAPPNYPPAPSYAAGPPPSEVDNNLGIIALVTGLVGLLVLPPVAIAAIIFGRKSQTAAAAGRATNGSLGTAGFVMGVIGTILFAVYFVIGILLVIAIAGVGLATF